MITSTSRGSVQSQAINFLFGVRSPLPNKQFVLRGSHAHWVLLVVGLLTSAHPGVAQSVPYDPTTTLQDNHHTVPLSYSASRSAELTTQPVDTYRLGEGDRLHLDFFNIPEYTGEIQVLPDGTLNLPLIGSIQVQDMTLQETSEAITLAYQNLLRNPIITVSLIQPRPLRVSIAGEINRPGSYSLPLTSEVGGTDEAQWPTVTQAIQLAGGITEQADIGNIRIQREQNADAPQEIQVNLWELLQQADLSQDIPLRDGDHILISTTTSLQPAELTQLSTASFAPDTIRVSVVGEVVTPGVVEVPPNTPLNQALLAAGGFDRSRARTSQVELIRLNPDGSATQQTVAIDFSQGINDSTNPILRNNDVIVVGRSDAASFSDSVDSVLDTVGRIFPFLTLF